MMAQSCISEDELRKKGKNKAIEIIKSAKREIYIEVWSQEFKNVEQALFDEYPVYKETLVH